MVTWKLLKYQANTIWLSFCGKKCTICSGIRKEKLLGGYNSEGGEKRASFF